MCVNIYISDGDKKAYLGIDERALVTGEEDNSVSHLDGLSKPAGREMGFTPGTLCLVVP
jgi:hypothetical protein